MTDGITQDDTEYIAGLAKEKCPVSGLRQYVYDYLRGVIRPESESQAGFFEIGDAIVEGYDVGRKVHLVRLVNEIADTLGLLENVDMLGKIQAWDKKAAQKDAMILALDRIAERLQESPDSANLLPGWLAYDSWAEDQALVGMFDAFTDAIVSEPCEVLALPEPMTPTPLVIDVPAVISATPTLVYARTQRRRPKRVTYERARKGIRRSCANLGYDGDGKWSCLEHDKHVTPSLCRRCRSYTREDA